MSRINIITFYTEQSCSNDLVSELEKQGIKIDTTMSFSEGQPNKKSIVFRINDLNLKKRICDGIAGFLGKHEKTEINIYLSDQQKITVCSTYNVDDLLKVLDKAEAMVTRTKDE